MKVISALYKGRTSLLVAAGLLTGGAMGCGPAHISSYTPKRRVYQYEAADDEGRATPSTGSLWLDDRPASMLFTDARALRINDLVVVKVEEIADARRRADTQLDRESTTEANIKAFLGAMAQAKVGHFSQR